MRQGCAAGQRSTVRQSPDNKVKPLSMREYFSGRIARPPAAGSGLLALAVWLEPAAGSAQVGVPVAQSSWAGMPVLVAASVILLFFGGLLLRKFSMPLNNLERISRQMADCQLQELVSEPHTRCRLTGRIAANINELALNLQEVLLLVWNLSHQDLEALDRIAARLDREPNGNRQPITNDLEFIRKDLEEMQEIVRQFEFFNVMLRNEKLLAKPEPASMQEREE